MANALRYRLHLWKLSLLELLREMMRDMAQRGSLLPRRRRAGRWRVEVDRRPLDETLSPSQLEALMRRHRLLSDADQLADSANRMALPEGDFRVTREQAEATLRAILAANPPFLALSETLPDPASGQGGCRLEAVKKRILCHETTTQTLLFPEAQDRRAERESAAGEPILRPLRHLSDLLRAPLLMQVLPPEVQFDKIARHEMMITGHREDERRVVFQPRDVVMERDVWREVEHFVEVQDEANEDGKCQLFYFLFDTSASMQGENAMLAVAAACAVLRRHLDRRSVYYFRSFAQALDPPGEAPPRCARSLQEKESLMEQIFALSFNGSATRTNWALHVAARDIADARQSDSDLGEATILLITDGNFVTLPSVTAELVRLGVTVHTVSLGRRMEPELARLSASCTMLRGLPQLRQAPLPAAPPTPKARQSLAGGSPG